MGILRTEDHKKQLMREQSILRFRYELKRGALNESERDQIEGLRLWGFEPDTKQMKENIKRLAQLTLAGLPSGRQAPSQLAAEEHLTKTV